MKKYNRTENKNVIRKTVDIEAFDVAETSVSVEKPASPIEERMLRVKLLFCRIFDGELATFVNACTDFADVLTCDMSDEAGRSLDELAEFLARKIRFDLDENAYWGLSETLDYVGKCKELRDCFKDMSEASFPGNAFVATGTEVEYGVDERLVFLGWFETAGSALEVAKSYFKVGDDDFFRFKFADGRTPDVVSRVRHVE